MIRDSGSQIARKELGVHWADRYIKRYEVDLISRWATGIDRSRHQADSQLKYSLQFELKPTLLPRVQATTLNITNIQAARSDRQWENKTALLVKN
jgi:hypothetical protein